MVDPTKLRILQAIERHGSLAAVARIMYLTPSAVSQQIRQLAEEVKADLLEREGRSVRLTPAAHRLLEFSYLASEAWEDTRADLETLSVGDRLSGHLSVSSFATAIPALVAPAASSLCSQTPEVTITVQEMGTTDSLDHLTQQTVDLAILAAPTNPPLDDPRFEQSNLVDDPQDLVVAQSSNITSQGVSRLRDVSDESWIEPHIDQRRLIESACEMEGFAPRFTHQANDWNAVLALVAAGMGLCLYPRMAPLDRSGVMRVPLTGTNLPIRRVLTCIRAGSGQRPVINAFLKSLTRSAPGPAEDR